ncbi:uncharacterized protein [Primulina huaijiensis]|uniref:uncharacterized protein n=1 Tax=Primulina huaijiensis TaxID=1492673 RepID=UPI003CC6E52D
MAATTVSIQPRPCSANFQALSLYSSTNSHLPISTFLQLQRRPAATLLLLLQKGRNPIHNNGFWGVSSRSGMVMGDYGGDFDDDDEDDEEDEGEDRSLDLLIRFVENVFKKVSRKARKAVKSVLPIHISTKLVGFAVNGTIILTFLWVLKAFLENTSFGAGRICSRRINYLLNLHQSAVELSGLGFCPYSPYPPILDPSMLHVQYSLYIWILVMYSCSQKSSFWQWFCKT